MIFPSFSAHQDTIGQLFLAANDIQSIPDHTFVNLSSLLNLDLSDNRLSQIKDTDFEGLGDLLSLNLTFNHLKLIKPGAFQHVPSLKYLYLSQNSLHMSLQQTLFSALYHLQLLYLDQNGIISLPERLFSNLKQLQTLSLAGNLLSSLNKDAFLELQSLQHLDLSGNQLQTVPSRSLATLSNLHDLKLDGNPIYRVAAFALDSLNLYAVSLNNMRELTIIESDAFVSLPVLSKLEISRNPKLLYISPAAIRDTPTLSSLLLNDNNLKAIPGKLVKALPALKELHVYGNPLQCDCNVRWLRVIIENFKKDSVESNRNALNMEGDAIDSTNTLQIVRAGSIMCDTFTNSQTSQQTTTNSLQMTQSLLMNIPPENIPEECEPSAILLFPKEYNLQVGSSVSLECHALGIPEPHIQWILSSGKVLGQTSNDVRISWKNSNTIQIDHIKAHDSGTYTCSAMNSQGHDYAFTVLKVYSKNIHLLYKSIATNFVTVIWNNTESTIDTCSYVILYRRTGVKEPYSKVPIQSYMRAYTFTQLMPQTSYEFCIAYVNNQKQPAKLNCMEVTTKHKIYVMAGIKSMHSGHVIATICVLASVIAVACIVTAACRSRCRQHKDYKDPAYSSDKFYYSYSSNEMKSNSKYVENMSHIPLENLYTAPSTSIPSTPLCTTPLCTSTTSLLSITKT